MVSDKEWKAKQQQEIDRVRRQHMILGNPRTSLYMWCNWFNEVGLLVLKPAQNTCDRCKRILWGFYDTRPSPYARAINSS